MPPAGRVTPGPYTFVVFDECVPMLQRLTRVSHLSATVFTQQHFACLFTARTHPGYSLSPFPHAPISGVLGLSEWRDVEKTVECCSPDTAVQC